MNQLFYGDNLDILRSKVRDETIDLCYIDPPFNVLKATGNSRMLTEPQKYAIYK